MLSIKKKLKKETEISLKYHLRAAPSLSEIHDIWLDNAV